DTRLAFDRLKLVFYAGADSGIGVQLQHALIVQLDLAPQMREIVGANPVQDLPRNILGAVVAGANVDGAAIAGRAGSLRVQVHLADSILAGEDLFLSRIPAPVVRASAGQHSVPGIFIKRKRQHHQVPATARRAESSKTVVN